MYRLVKRAALVVAVTVVLAPLAAGAAPMDGMSGPVARVDLGSHQVQWSPLADYAGFQLTVSGPAGVEQIAFGPGESPSFDLAALSGAVDGQYSWELRAVPNLDDATKNLIAQMRSEDSMGVARQRPAGLPPADQLVQSGAFRVLDGAILQPAEEAPAPVLRVQGAGAGADGIGNVTGQLTATGDLYVFNSACVGFDCVNNGESFGADTIRLKENNLRIHAEDTSTASGFPTTDWRLVFNDSASGGASFFRVADVSNSRNIMTLEASAPSHSLYVDDGGRVGFGTNTPVVDLHVKDGDTPTLRLEQDTSSGFAAQTWDVAGNETSFFVRDATNGSTLPFRIRPGASSNVLVIDQNDRVGVGILSPSELLHVSDTSAGGGIFIETNGAATLKMDDTSQVNTWQFFASNAFQFDNLSNTGVEFQVNPNGDVIVLGTLTTNGPTCGTGCDHVFAPDFPLESIEKHAAYMWEHRHLPAVGPTAPNAPFNVSEKTGGILNELEKAHIYIEQLNYGLKSKNARIQQLESRLAALEALLDQAPPAETDER